MRKVWGDSMNRASAPDLRKAIEAAHTLLKAGILFVPVPVMDEADRERLQSMLFSRLEALGALVAEDEAT